MFFHFLFFSAFQNEHFNFLFQNCFVKLYGKKKSTSYVGKIQPKDLFLHCNFLKTKLTKKKVFLVGNYVLIIKEESKYA